MTNSLPRRRLRLGGENAALNSPIGQWHGVEALEFGTVILECKDGPYEPLWEEDILKI